MSKRSAYLSPVLALLILQLAACAPQSGKSSYTRTKPNGDQPVATDGTGRLIDQNPNGANKPSVPLLVEKQNPSVPLDTDRSLSDKSPTIAPVPQTSQIIPESKKLDVPTKTDSTQVPSPPKDNSAVANSSQKAQVAPTAIAPSKEEPKKITATLNSDKPVVAESVKPSDPSEDPDQPQLTLQQSVHMKIDILNQADFASSQKTLTQSKYFFDILSFQFTAEDLAATAKRFGPAYQRTQSLISSKNTSSLELRKSFQEIHDSLALMEPKFGPSAWGADSLQIKMGTALMKWLGRLQQKLAGVSIGPVTIPENLAKLVNEAPNKILALSPMLTIDEQAKYFGKFISLAHSASVAMRVNGASPQTHDILRKMVETLKANQAFYDEQITAPDKRNTVQELMNWREQTEAYLKTTI